MKHITQILTISTLLCSCEHGRPHERHGVNSNKDAAREKAQITCSWDEDFLDGEKVLTIVDQMPDYNGGMRHYYELIGRDIRIPEDQKMWQSIVVIFIVDTLGRVRNECLLDKKLTDPLTVVEKEALKSVKNHQDWRPAYHNGKKVPVKLALPLTIGHRG